MQSRVYPIIAAFAVLFFGIFIATYFGIYDMIPRFDKVMHFAGGFTAAWFFAVYFSNDLKKLSPIEVGVILVALASLVGVLWEFLEYISDVYMPIYAPMFSRYLFIGDLTDTLGDLAVDMLGGAVLWLISLKIRSEN